MVVGEVVDDWFVGYWLVVLCELYQQVVYVLYGEFGFVQVVVVCGWVWQCWCCWLVGGMFGFQQCMVDLVGVGIVQCDLDIQIVYVVGMEFFGCYVEVGVLQIEVFEFMVEQIVIGLYIVCLVQFVELVMDFFL